MNPKDLRLPDLVDERLREWGDFHRDRAKYLRCGSLEGRYIRRLGEDDGEGWGDPESAPEAVRARPRDWILRAIETNEEIMRLNLVQKWAVTYAYCYPLLPKFVVLRAMKKFTRRSINWREYLDQVDLARVKLWARLDRRAA